MDLSTYFYLKKSLFPLHGPKPHLSYLISRSKSLSNIDKFIFKFSKRCIKNGKKVIVNPFSHFLLLEYSVPQIRRIMIQQKGCIHIRLSRTSEDTPLQISYQISRLGMSCSIAIAYLLNQLKRSTTDFHRKGRSFPVHRHYS